MSQGKSTRDVVSGFGEKVREARELRGWSQGELAERAGTHVQTVSNLEREYRAVSLRLALALAEALGVPLAELVPPDWKDRDANEAPAVTRRTGPPTGKSKGKEAKRGGRSG